MKNLLHNKYVLYGGVGIAAIGAYMLFFRGGSAQAAPTSGDTQYPSVTYAATPIASNGGVIGTSGGDIGTSALQTLQSAISDATAGQWSAQKDIQLASIDANKSIALGNQKITIFNTLTGILKAHTGLSYINAVIPGQGRFTINERPPATIHKPPAKKPAVKPVVHH